MIPKMIEGATRVCGKSQGYAGLPIRDEPIEMAFERGIERVNAMYSSWEPTPEELERLNAGAPVVLCLLGNSPPPMRVEVGQPASSTGGSDG